MNTHPIPATVLLTLAPDQTASRVQIYTDGFTRKDFDRYAAADISDARNDPDGPQDAWIVRYDFADQRKIPGSGRTARKIMHARFCAGRMKAASVPVVSYRCTI